MRIHSLSGHLLVAHRKLESITVAGLVASLLWGSANAGNQVPSSGNLLYDIQNPFAYIPRIQIENHFDGGEGRFNASTYRLRMRPIIPVDFNDDWGLRTRSTINMTYQSAPNPLAAGQLGFGDMDLEFYFVPRRSLDKDMLLVGFGPSVHIPTATKSLIGSHQWGVGASAAVIWQPASIYALKGWTFAFNANQTFGFAPEVQAQSQNLVSFQPNVTYTTESEISFGMFSETYYNWTRNQWTVPVNAGVSFLLKPGGQNLVVTLIGRYFAERSAYDPQWGTQINFNFLFPEGP